MKNTSKFSSTKKVFKNISNNEYMLTLAFIGFLYTITNMEKNPVIATIAIIPFFLVHLSSAIDYIFGE